MRKIRMSGSVGASGEQSPEATRPRMLPLPPLGAELSFTSLRRTHQAEL